MEEKNPQNFSQSLLDETLQLQHAAWTESLRDETVTEFLLDMMSQ
jgi:hypothetical protein